MLIHQSDGTDGTAAENVAESPDVTDPAEATEVRLHQQLPLTETTISGVSGFQYVHVCVCLLSSLRRTPTTEPAGSSTIKDQ